MFNKNKKKLSRLVVLVLNSKITYIILILIILIQFVMVSIIFFQNKKDKYLIEQTNFKAATIENQQKQLSTQMTSLQSTLMRMSSQLYRLQGENQ